MNRRPIIKGWINSVASDHEVDLMTPLEFGLYMRVAMYLFWRRGEVEFTDATFARVARCDVRTAKKYREKISHIAFRNLEQKYVETANA